jgi:hypothetical protein
VLLECGREVLESLSRVQPDHDAVMGLFALGHEAEGRESGRDLLRRVERVLARRHGDDVRARS